MMLSVGGDGAWMGSDDGGVVLGSGVYWRVDGKMVGWSCVEGDWVMVVCPERWGGPLSVPFGGWEVRLYDGGPRLCQARHAATAKGGGADCAVVRGDLVRRRRGAVGMGARGHLRHAAWRRGTSDGAGGKGDS